MKVLIDTNILVSSALYQESMVANAFFKATQFPYEALLCDYCLDEFKRISTTKLIRYSKGIDKFLEVANLLVQIVKTPTEFLLEERLIRDINDRPILRAAIKENVDIILTGDKDFLESGILYPKMMSPSDFMKLL